MERAVAIKKLAAILGKSLGYRVDPKAPTREEREGAQAQLTGAIAERKAASEQVAARCAAILRGDAEYQRLKAEYEQHKTRCDRLFSTANHYKITVGTSSSLFFHIRAQGDSWEDVIAKLKVPA